MNLHKRRYIGKSEFLEVTDEKMSFMQSCGSASVPWSNQLDFSHGFKFQPNRPGFWSDDAGQQNCLCPDRNVGIACAGIAVSKMP